jgi:membrane-associated protein
MHDLLHPVALVKDFGYTGIFIVLFLESGIPFGFFLPGDSLLFTAGLLASQHYLNIVGLIVVSVAAAILGNNAGYVTGKRFGHSLFKNHDSVWFSPKRLDEAHHFFIKEGPQSLVLARFIPAGRTFVPIAAGAAKMDYKKFLLFNAVGGLLWGVGLPTLGYTLGQRVPNIDKYLLPTIFLIIVVSALPAIYHWYKHRKKTTQ